MATQTSAGEKKAEKKVPVPKQEAKKETAKPAPSGQAGELDEELSTIATQCDLRVGKIVGCEKHPDSEKLYIEKIDLGEDGGRIRTIVSGLQPFVTMEEMLEGQCVVFANLKAKKLAGIPSEGMVMCAGNAEHTEVQLMRPPAGSKVGDRIQLEGNPIGSAPLPAALEKTLNPKKKIEGKFLPELTTNDACEGMFHGIRLVTDDGPIICKSLKNVNIK